MFHLRWDNYQAVIYASWASKYQTLLFSFSRKKCYFSYINSKLYSKETFHVQLPFLTVFGTCPWFLDYLVTNTKIPRTIMISYKCKIFILKALSLSLSRPISSFLKMWSVCITTMDAKENDFITHSKRFIFQKMNVSLSIFTDDNFNDFFFFCNLCVRKC